MAVGLRAVWRVAILVGALTLPAQAQNRSAPLRSGSFASAAERSTGTAEFGVGWLTLPGAKVCVTRIPLGCSRGDSSLVAETWQMFRLDPAFALGGGLVLGLTPTAAPERNAVSQDLKRDHTRRYLNIEAMGRYFPYLGEVSEAWLGVTVGAAVISDAFATISSLTDDRDLVGPKGVTIRTEGFTLGAAVGFAHELGSSWLVGANLRYDNWFFPRTPARDPLRDEASLVGWNSVFVLAVNIGYRVLL